LAIDLAGNLYVNDNSSEVIRKVSPSGEVTTLAGAIASYKNKLIYCPIDPTTEVGAPGHKGCADGQGYNALFNDPQGIGVARDGTLYVADTGNNLIRKISAGGVVTTLAGSPPAAINGPGLTARMGIAFGVAMDASGNTYFTDSYNYVIRKVSSTGVVSIVAGKAGVPGSDDGIGINARFDRPQGIAVDSAGNVCTSPITIISPSEKSHPMVSSLRWPERPARSVLKTEPARRRALAILPGWPSIKQAMFTSPTAAIARCARSHRSESFPAWPARGA
jgi:sugar lactone lactonase YvrE